MQPGWVRDIGEQCSLAGVPFFFKQWGAWAWSDQLTDEAWKALDASDSGAHDWLHRSESAPARIGKSAAGAELDGREWRQFPNAR